MPQTSLKYTPTIFDRNNYSEILINVLYNMNPCIYPCLICTEYIEEIFQTFLNATKDDLKKAAKQLKENAPPAMNMMLNKQSKAEAVKKRDERKKIVVKNVPPTTPGI